jgi:hypothetical protein
MLIVYHIFNCFIINWSPLKENHLLEVNEQRALYLAADDTLNGQELQLTDLHATALLANSARERL